MNCLMKKLTEFISNEEGDMAEKTVMWAVILLVAIGAFVLLGEKIVEAVNNVAGKI